MPDSVPTQEKSDQSLFRNPLVMSAVDALAAFGDLGRDGVRHVLPYWRHFWELSSQEVEAVYNRFADDDVPDDVPPESRVVNPGGGFVSGTPAWPGSRETDDRRDRR